MKEYIIETVKGMNRVHSRAKAQSLDNLRARLIKEGLAKKYDQILVFTTNAQKVDEKTPFKKTGVIWYDGYNQQNFWMNNSGRVYNVSEKDGTLSKFAPKVGL